MHQVAEVARRRFRFSRIASSCCKVAFVRNASNAEARTAPLTTQRWMNGALSRMSNTVSARMYAPPFIPS
jgi:hypothetical protein